MSRNSTSLKRERSVVPGPARAIVLLCEFSSSMVAQMRSQVVPAVSDAVRLARNSSSASLKEVISEG